MKADPHPEAEAVVLAPEPGDDPADLEDRIHDTVLRGPEEGRKVSVVVLDLSGVENPGPWMKAAGPEVPDCNLRVALGPKHFLTAKALKLDAVFEWYADVEVALRGGV